MSNYIQADDHSIQLHNARGVKQPIFKPLNAAFIRIPSLPIESLPSTNMEAIAVAQENLAHEAISIASPDLIDALSRSEQLSSKKKGQLHNSILRYVIRMSSRTTPFGLFSGVAYIAVGEGTFIPLAAPAKHRHRTRLDMEWLLDYIKLLEYDPKIQAALTYTYQPIVTRVGNRYYFEHRDREDRPKVTSVIATSGVEKLINKTRGGKKYDDLLCEMLADIPEATPESMKAFFDQFIGYGIIYSSLRPPLTCADPVRYVIAQLSRIGSARTVTRKLRDLLSDIEQYDICPPGGGEAVLQDVIAKAISLHPMPSKRIPLDVDLALKFTDKPYVQRSIATDAATLAELLIKLANHSPDTAPLSIYKQIFIARYGRYRLVPLLELLNHDIGIGPPSHYVDKSRLQQSLALSSDRDELFFSLALTAMLEKRSVVMLDDALIDRLTYPQFTPDACPSSLDIAVQIAATSEAEVNRNNYLLACSPLVGAPNAGFTAGRFADMLGSKATAHLQAVADLPNARNTSQLQAELIYLPGNGHAANVTIRPSVRQYEIVVGTAPGVAPSHVIALNDLYVGLRGDRLYIWSASHQKEVIVRAGHMLSMANAPSVCRLLVDISGQVDLHLKAFHWGAAARLPILPRLSYGRLVLSLAEWKLKGEDILDAPLIGKNGERIIPPSHEWYMKFQAWRNRWNVPRFVYLMDNDNRLLLDLDSETHVMELFYAISSHGKLSTLSLQEALPGPTDAWITGEGGRYMNECVFQLVRTPISNLQEKRTLLPTYQDIPTAERLHMPGGQWLSCKLYTPARQQDEFLALYMYQLINAVRERHAADGWFFLRYADPEPHIRLRFKTSDVAMIQAIMPIVTSWAKQMQAVGLLHKLVIDSYDREIERYGGTAAIQTAETLFAAESEVDLEIIRLSVQNKLQGLSLDHISVLTTTILLGAFSLNHTQQAAWAKDHVSRKEFAGEYRNNRQKLISLLDGHRGLPKEIPQEIQTLYKQLEQNLMPCGYVYRTLESNGELTVPVPEILQSFVHMHCNRLLGTDQLQENRLLTYLERSLSDLEKQKSNK